MRRTQQFSIEDRGVTKNFEIREMPCMRMELWAIRAGRLLAKTGVISIPDIDAMSSATLPVIAQKIIKEDTLATLAGFDFDEFKKLQAEMLQTVSIIQAKGNKMVLTDQTIEGNIEDYRTVFKLLLEAIKFNLNFSSAGDSPSQDTPQSEAAAPLQKNAATRRPTIQVRS